MPFVHMYIYGDLCNKQTTPVICLILSVSLHLPLSTAIERNTLDQVHPSVTQQTRSGSRPRTGSPTLSLHCCRRGGGVWETKTGKNRVDDQPSTYRRYALMLMRHCDVAVGPCRVLHPGPAASRSPSSPHPYRSSTDPAQHDTAPGGSYVERPSEAQAKTPPPIPPYECRPPALRPSPTEPGRASHFADPRAQERDALPLPPFRPAPPPCSLPPVVALARTLDTWTQATVEWSSVKKKLDLVARGKVFPFLQTEASRSRATPSPLA